MFEMCKQHVYLNKNACNKSPPTGVWWSLVTFPMAYECDVHKSRVVSVSQAGFC
jgi:hypothetical protein